MTSMGNGISKLTEKGATVLEIEMCGDDIAQWKHDIDGTFYCDICGRASESANHRYIHTYTSDRMLALINPDGDTHVLSARHAWAYMYDGPAALDEIGAAMGLDVDDAWRVAASDKKGHLL